MFVLALILQLLLGEAEGELLLGEKVISEVVNSLQTTWKAGRNGRFDGLTFSAISKQMGVLQEES